MLNSFSLGDKNFHFKSPNVEKLVDASLGMIANSKLILTALYSDQLWASSFTMNPLPSPSVLCNITPY